MDYHGDEPDGYRGSVSRRQVITTVGETAVIGLAGCSEIVSSGPTYSYGAMTGTWTASTYPEDSDYFVHSHAQLEVTKDRATAGEEVGTLTLFVEKGGEVHCESTLTAHDSDPPGTFWLNVDGNDFPCSSHLRYRFQPATPNKLEWYITYDKEDYRKVSDLKRANRRESATPTTSE